MYGPRIELGSPRALRPASKEARQLALSRLCFFSSGWAKLEHELSCELKRSCILGTRQFPKIAAIEAGSDGVELGVVEEVEAIDTQLEAACFGDGEGLEEGAVDVEATRSHDSILAGVAKALVRSTRPGGDGSGERGLIEPGFAGTGFIEQVSGLRDFVGSIRCISPQTDRIGVIAQGVWPSCLCNENSRHLPSTKETVRPACAMVENRQIVDEVGVEVVPTVELARTAVIVEVEWVGGTVELVAHDVDLVRPGIVGFAREAVTLLHADAGLQAVVANVTCVFLGRDARESRELTVQVCVDGAAGYGLPERAVEGQRVDGAIDLLMPP